MRDTVKASNAEAVRLVKELGLTPVLLTGDDAKTARRVADEDDHVNHCVADALSSGDKKVASEKSKDLLEAVKRFARTR